MKKDKHLRTGGDPRALPDYIALREELMKLSHPARPDVDWKYTESLCLRLFENNGVELQTAAWYLLARTHIAGLAGISEGLALINALSTWQWSVMWPGSTPARMEIITGLNQRLQKAFRTLPLADRDDLALLYQIEKSLATFIEILTRHELKQASRLDVLQQQVGQAITRLENAPHGGEPETEVTLPPQAVATESAESLSASGPRIYVVHPSPAGVTGSPGTPGEREVADTDRDAAAGFPLPARPAGQWPRRSARRAFFLGAGSALLVGGLLLWGVHALMQPSPAQRQLAASLTPLPERLSAQQLSELRHASVSAEIPAGKLQAQLKWLMSLPPGWPERYGRELIDQARILWPDNPAVRQMQQQWQRELEDNAQPASALVNWHEGMQKLQKLAGRLNGLDEKRGKYMTVSELKSEVFAITQAFNRSLPVEELLRRYDAQSPDLQPRQIETALEQLQKRYVLLSDKSAINTQDRPATSEN